MNFYISDAMLENGLKLKGCELMIFAVIYSFSKQGLPMYSSMERLSNLFGYSREHVTRSISVLLNKKLIAKSTKKHQNCQTFEYYVNWEEIKHFAPELLLKKENEQGGESGCDRKSQTCVTKSHSKKKSSDLKCDEKSQRDVMKNSSGVSENITVGCDKKTQNNEKNNNTDKEMDINRSSPFKYFYLNYLWEKLLSEARWRKKSASSLKISLHKLLNVSPNVAVLRLSYSLEKGYGEIFEINGENARPVMSEEEFFKKETSMRIPEYRNFLSMLQNARGVENIDLPTEKSFRVIKNGVVIMCQENFRDWLECEINESPVLKNALRKCVCGLKLTYMCHSSTINT